MSAMLPDLGRLALQHAHEEEEVPTGVLDSAIGKASKKRRWLSKWKQDEAERPQLEGLPLELRHMVTDQLVARNAGDGVTLCKELEAWCRAHPIACTKPGLWQAAFEAAFGRLNPPRGVDVWLWPKAFGRFPPERDGAPVANRVEGGKRPRSSMAPTIVLRDGRPVLVLGSPGGARIIGYVAATLVRMLDFGMSPAQAVAAGHVANLNGVTHLEAGTEAEALAGPLGETRAFDMNSGLHVIAIAPDGRLTGAADPRREGVALGD